MKKPFNTVALALLAAFSVPAMALGTVDVTLNSLGLGNSTSVSSNSGVSYSNVWAGFTNNTLINSTTTDVLDGLYELFCLQLLQSSAFGTANTFGVPPTLAGSIPDGSPGALSPIAASAVGNMFSEAAGSQYLSNDTAAAFQLALWDITFDYDGTLYSLNLDAGTFRANTTPAVAGLFSLYADSAVNGYTLTGDTTYGLQNLKVQDLAFFTPAGRATPCVDCNVQEPGSLALFGVCLLGLSYIYRRTRVVYSGSCFSPSGLV